MRDPPVCSGRGIGAQDGVRGGGAGLCGGTRRRARVRAVWGSGPSSGGSAAVRRAKDKPRQGLCMAVRGSPWRRMACAAAECRRAVSGTLGCTTAYRNWRRRRRGSGCSSPRFGSGWDGAQGRRRRVRRWVAGGASRSGWCRTSPGSWASRVDVLCPNEAKSGVSWGRSASAARNRGGATTHLRRWSEPNSGDARA